MDASAVDHRKTGVAGGEYVRQVGACDQHRLCTVGPHELPGDLAQFVGFCIRSVTLDELLIKVVDFSTVPVLGTIVSMPSRQPNMRVSMVKGSRANRRVLNLVHRPPGELP